MEQINPNNLYINGTFEEFMETVRREVERLCNKDVTKPPIIISLNTYDPPGDRQICYIVDINKQTHFLIAKSEFKIKNATRKYLGNLINCRFTDAIFSIEYQIENLFLLLKRFDPKWKTPNCYER